MTRIVPSLRPSPPILSGPMSSQHNMDEQQPGFQSSQSGFDVESYAHPFIAFSSENPTTFHTIAHFSTQLQANGFTKLSEREPWGLKLSPGGKYFFERNSSSLIAFTVGTKFQAGNGAAIIASHADVLTTRLKPISALPTKAGYVQLGVAPYAGGLNSTWWDRDLGIGGRVLVRNNKTGKIETKLVKLGWPIARVPTLAPHFGAPSRIANANKETQMVPIIGLDNSDINGLGAQSVHTHDSKVKPGTFAATQPERLVQAIAGELEIQDYNTIINWELELYDIQPAQLGGLEKEFIFAGRIDDRLCSFSAIEALIASSSHTATQGGGDDGSSDESGILKIVGLFDDEEIGSLLRQGARSNLLPSTIGRITESFTSNPHSANLIAQSYANSFLISADVGHAINPNYLSTYLENHAPRLNVGVAVQADPQGNTTTDSVSTALLQRIAEKSDSVLQVFQIRNDSRSGGTVGPALSSATGIRAIDAGLPQLSMHSIRATTGRLDPGLGVKLFKGFFDHFEEVDREFVE